MKRGVAPLHIDRNGYHLTFESVPAWVCTQCGEAYFEEREVAIVQTMITDIDGKTEQLREQPLVAV